MYHRTKEILNTTLKVTEQGHFVVEDERYAVNKTGHLIQKPYVKYFVPYTQELDWLEWEWFIDKQLYFQKWAAQTNVSFWNLPKKEEIDSMIIVQQTFDADRMLHDNIVVFPDDKVVEFDIWVKELGKLYLEYQTNYVVYYVVRMRGFTYCLDIDFFDTKQIACNFENIVEKKSNKFGLLINGQELTKEFETDNFSVHNKKAFVIGYRQNDPNYNQWITD